MTGWVALAVTASAGFAVADEAQYKRELATLAGTVKQAHLKASPGREQAAPQAPQYCHPGLDLGQTPGGIGRALTNMKTNEHVLTAARYTCNFPKEPIVQQAVAIVLQQWIEWTGLTAAEAQESLKYRLNEAKFEADREALCKTFNLDDEVGGEVRIFDGVRARLFGCGSYPALWIDGQLGKTDEIVYFLDQSSAPIDPLVRVAVVIDTTGFTQGDEPMDPVLTARAQVVHAIDFRDLDLAKARAVANQAPYKGNTYAKAVILESTARAKFGVAALRESVKKLTADASWKQLLVTAPDAGIAAYEKDAIKYAEAIATSNAYETAFWGPSKKAQKGCFATLSKDFAQVMKPLKRSNPKELEVSMSQPIPALLFRRLAACSAVDMPGEFSELVLARSADLRFSRGPRYAAYYAALDALTEILEDRSKFPITPSTFVFSPTDLLYGAATRIETKKTEDPMGYVMDGSGQVKAAKAAGDKVQISWVSSKKQVMTFNCKATNRIQRIDRSGNIIYQENCKEAGMVWENTTPEGVTMNALFAGGITAGSYVDFRAGRGNSPARPGMPAYVYKDKSKKEIVNYYGIKLN